MRKRSIVKSDSDFQQRVSPIHSDGPIARWLGPTVLAVVGLIMLSWSWLKWPDVLIDYGQQLYIAWQLSEGQTLYTDIVYNYGPLAPYAMALWFRLFGVGMMTLVVTNLLILIVIVILLYRLLMMIGNRIAATCAMVVFLTIFAFAQLAYCGNYNYVTPYETNITYGVFFSLLALTFLVSFVHGRHPWSIFGVGFSLGFVFLTKPEIFVAAAVSSAIGLVATLAYGRPKNRSAMTFIGLVIGGFLVTPLASVLLLSLAMPVDQAFHGTLGSWPSIFASDIPQLSFYRSGLGFDDVSVNLGKMLTCLGWYVVCWLPPALLSFVIGRRPPTGPELGFDRVGTTIAVMVFVVMVTILGKNIDKIPWPHIARALPLVTFVSVAVIAINLVRNSQYAELRRRTIIQLIMFIFAATLLLKMILNARLYHFGFVLAMPATLLLVMSLVEWIPTWINSRGGRGQVFAAAGYAVIVVTIVAELLFFTTRYFYHKQIVVSHGSDKIMAGFRGEHVNAAIHHIEEYARPNQTLVVMPEGIMLNYLTRRSSPVRYTNYIPPPVVLHGEETILRALQESPPDFVLLAHKDTSEFGYRFFGHDYAQSIMKWLQMNYDTVERIGNMPLRNEQFGMLLLRHVDLSNSEPKI